MDWKKLTASALPYIGAAVTGNVPMLLGMAAKDISNALGREIEPTAEAIMGAVIGAKPEEISRIREAEQTFSLKMQELGFKHAKDMAEIGLQETKAYIDDTKDAREKHAQNQNVFRLGVVILLTFAAMIGLSLWGSYLLLSGGITVADVGMVAAVFGFLGTIIGYVAGNAAQVVGFFFGSSKGSGDKNDTMAAAMKDLGAALSKK